LGLAAALFTAALSGGASLFAQTSGQGQAGAPLQLVPRQSDDTATPPAAGSGDASTGQGAATQALPDETSKKAGIEVLSLDQIDLDGIGLLDPKDSGLGPDPWMGTERSTAVALLRQLPQTLTSPVLLSLGEHLLLAKAPPPQGPTSAVEGFLDLRLQLLFDWGLAEEVRQILGRLPHSRQSETSFRLWVQALLVDGQDQAACDLVRREIVAYSSQDFWAKALIFCQILDGSVEQAYLGLDLLRETGAKDDPLFSALAQRFAGADADVTGEARASVLNFALLRHLGTAIPRGFAAKAPRALWPALAAAENLDPLERASLSESAFSSGLITAETLATAYRALPFSADELAGALTSADRVDGVLGRALLFQAAEAQKLVVTRAEILRSLLELARSEHRTAVVLPVVARLMEDLRPRTDMAWFAETAVRSFYILDKIELARGWLRLIERDAASAPEGQAALRRLWPLARLRGQQDLLPDTDLAEWGGQLTTDDAVPADSRQADLRRIYLLFAAFRALDLADATSVTMLPDWAETTEQFSVSSPLLLALYDAGQSRREGEGILLALSAVGGRQWNEVAVTEAAEILNLLRDLGLTEAVRRLAMEIALANDL